MMGLLKNAKYLKLELKPGDDPRTSDFNPNEEAKESFYFKTLHRHLDINTDENIKNKNDKRVRNLLEDTVPTYFLDENELDENERIIRYINKE